MGDASQLSQLVQAMAGFGSGSSAAESLNTVPLGADGQQKPFLPAPQHAYQGPNSSRTGATMRQAFNSANVGRLHHQHVRIEFSAQTLVG